ncbi:MAG TPA: nuclear transport factor 2 family protein [Dokdonella sp.]
MHAEIERLEERLRVAMLASDVAELDALIDDRLLFIGPDGRLYRKNDDLDLYRSGAQRLTRVDLEDVAVERHGSTAVTVVLANLAGEFNGRAFEGRSRYTRTWVRGEHGWKIVSGSVVPSPR